MKGQVSRPIGVLGSIALVIGALLAGVTAVSAQDTATLTVVKVLENGWANDDPSDWDITIDDGVNSPITATPDATTGKAVFADIPVSTYTVT
ncbi:MAG TPA: hypothetical protein ENL12_04395, partial [Dehalococcoidia bacterium]|nr:hypothetical protein [Dehalococcoidia bacterium]